MISYAGQEKDLQELPHIPPNINYDSSFEKPKHISTPYIIKYNEAPCCSYNGMSKG